MLLTDLVFSDLFVAETADTSWFKATPDSLATEAIPFECKEELLRLRSALDNQGGGSDFKVDWPAKEGSAVRLRIERLKVADEKTIYCCRRFRMQPGPLHTLGMPQAVAEKLMAPDLKEGIVVFLGKAGSGKTTTANSFVSERLNKYGGVCWTIENPIEIPMQGRHGQGMIYQTEVNSDDEIGPAISRLYRATPNIIMIGEIREGLAVREAIAAGTSGHLVVITFHANDLITGLARLARLAGDENASVALADALRVAIHLKLHNAEADKPLPGSALTANNPKGTGTPPRILNVQPLWMTDNTANGLKAIIRQGDFHMLKSAVEQQLRDFMNKKPQ